MSEGPPVPTGNTYDKYGSTNPLVKRLMAGFEGTLEQLFTRAAANSILDVGCGEAVLASTCRTRSLRPSGWRARNPTLSCGPSM